jgi:NAD(P)-dependent dehydrogenase (short-subunit alcohol dehydrogenase family)
LTAGRLKDRIALITGASRGLGRAVAEAFAREGAHVLLLARSRKALEQVDDRIRQGGDKATLASLPSSIFLPSIGSAASPSTSPPIGA